MLSPCGAWKHSLNPCPRAPPYSDIRNPRYRATAGILLAVIGVYSVMRHSVVDHLRETAIRLATGATRRHILLANIKNASVIFLVGLGIGVALAITLTRVLTSVLMMPVDKTVFVLCSAMLAAIVLLATYIPARFASKTDPMSILRWE